MFEGLYAELSSTAHRARLVVTPRTREDEDSGTTESPHATERDVPFGLHLRGFAVKSRHVRTPHAACYKDARDGSARESVLSRLARPRARVSGTRGYFPSARRVRGHHDFTRSRNRFPSLVSRHVVTQSRRFHDFTTEGKAPIVIGNSTPTTGAAEENALGPMKTPRRPEQSRVTGHVRVRSKSRRARTFGRRVKARTPPVVRHTINRASEGRPEDTHSGRW